MSIYPGEQVHLRWTGTDVTSCTASSTGYINEATFEIDGGFDTGIGSPATGTDTTITEPEIDREILYAVTCTNGYDVAEDDLLISTRDNPTATLEQRVGTSSAWSAADVTIDTGDKVELRWSSTNINPYESFPDDYGCVATAGTGFSTGTDNPATGTDTTITEPSSGNSETYAVTCTNITASTTASIIITTN